MLSTLAPAANHLNSHRTPYAIVATSMVVSYNVRKRYRLWKEFFADPEAFNIKYPDAK